MITGNGDGLDNDLRSTETDKISELIIDAQNLELKFDTDASST
mgnify:CR=1 FL=1